MDRNDKVYQNLCGYSKKYSQAKKILSIYQVYEDEHLHTNLSRLCILFNLNIYFIMYLFEKIIKNYDIYNININDEKSIK